MLDFEWKSQRTLYSLSLSRRRSELITPVPKPKKRRESTNQTAMAFDAGDDLSSKEQEYNPTPIINEIRTYVETWRNLPNSEQWLVTPETARLLKHWRSEGFQHVRPFFYQVEASDSFATRRPVGGRA